MVTQSQPHQEEQDFDHCLTSRHKFLSTESLKLVRAWNCFSVMVILTNVSQSQPRQMSIPLGKFPPEVGLHD